MSFPRFIPPLPPIPFPKHSLQHALLSPKTCCGSPLPSGDTHSSHGHVGPLCLRATPPAFSSVMTTSLRPGQPGSHARWRLALLHRTLPMCPLRSNSTSLPFSGSSYCELPTVVCIIMCCVSVCWYCHSHPPGSPLSGRPGSLVSMCLALPSKKANPRNQRFVIPWVRM